MPDRYEANTVLDSVAPLSVWCNKNLPFLNVHYVVHAGLRGVTFNK